MFFLAQLIGLMVISSYSEKTIQIEENGTFVNKSTHNLPYGMEPPENIDPSSTFISIVIAIILAVVIMLALMKFGASVILRFWFFFVIILALGITFNSAIKWVEYASIISLIIALPLAYIKVFKRNIIVHNLTELAIYPGIAAIFVPLLNIWTVVLLLILISIYDIYAVWHAGFMQKMAKYQIKTVKVFSGFFIPYLGKKQKEKLNKAKTEQKKMKVNIAILGGGDVVFPMIMAGVVMGTLGIFSALLISIGATLALAYLFYISE
jgi:presenilin-like A22 family membrane protease